MSMSGDELAVVLAAEQDGCLFVSHHEEYPADQAFQPTGTKLCFVPLVIIGSATREQYRAQIRRARVLSGDKTLSFNEHHTHFYRVRAAD